MLLAAVYSTYVQMISNYGFLLEIEVLAIFVEYSRTIERSFKISFLDYFYKLVRRCTRTRFRKSWTDVLDNQFFPVFVATQTTISISDNDCFLFIDVLFFDENIWWLVGFMLLKLRTNPALWSLVFIAVFLSKKFLCDEISSLQFSAVLVMHRRLLCWQLASSKGK